MGGGALGWLGGLLVACGLYGVIFAVIDTPLPLRFCVLAMVGLPLGVCLMILQTRFEDRERFARARMRRGECLVCGNKLGDSIERMCQGCRGRHRAI